MNSWLYLILVTLGFLALYGILAFLFLSGIAAILETEDDLKSRDRDDNKKI